MDKNSKWAIVLKWVNICKMLRIVHGTYPAIKEFILTNSSSGSCSQKVGTHELSTCLWGEIS